MIYEEYFPLGLADGKAFLGRESEQRLLEKNIEANRHTLLLSPRKYGKSSLVKHVLNKTHYPATDIDFFLVASAKSVESKILKGIRYLIKSLSDTPEYFLKVLTNYFRKANKQWTVGIKGLQLELIPDQYSDAQENILDALNALEYILAKKKQKAVLFIDEVQEIAKIEGNTTLEGAIRHFAQQAKYLMLIFSGSQRHMLEHMFGDSDRPLYDLCEKIYLERLHPNIYQSYLNHVSQLTWEKPLAQNAFDKIIALTECHPKVVYILCKKLWDYCVNNETIPSEKIVDHVWHNYIKEKLKDTRGALLKLSKGQIKIITYIALGEFTNLSGKKAQRHLDMSSSAIVQALSSLEQIDIIERQPSSHFRLIDPIIKATLAAYNRDYIIA